MPSYLSPGVYVEEVPSSIQAIAGVGTSTAGFIGIIPDSITVPLPNPQHNFALSPSDVVDFDIRLGAPLGMTLAQRVVLLESETLPEGVLLDVELAHTLKAQEALVTVRYVQGRADALLDKTLAADIVDPVSGEIIQIESNGMMIPLRAGHVVVQGQVGRIRDALASAGIERFEVQETVDMATHDADFLINKTLAAPVSVQTLPDGLVVQTPRLAQRIVQAMRSRGETLLAVQNAAFLSTLFTPVDAGEVKLCTNFGDFRKFFGDFSDDPGQNMLAHAVFGFFHNGGTRCYVARMLDDAGLAGVLEKFGAVDEIAIVAAPGLTDDTVRDAIVAHCKVATQDRFAIFDSPEVVEDNEGNLNLTVFDPSNANNILPGNSDYAAFYFPWIEVFDAATKIQNPKGNGRIYVPPSGHMAGVYARVDTARGVHKAPANEVVLGALDLKYQISKAQQDGLNPQGVNCIRELNGNIRVWGARTIGGDGNGEWRYINVRRVFLFLRESIDEGTQWAVFEPNDEKLWAKIKRNVSAFLTTVWRSGALFGSTPEQAFYVKCDAETNPPELREVGQVVTEIGVAVVRPAEFVIFRISQMAPQT
jgi:phage tail sheath protein FI